jgi:hypothetical protein
VKVRDQVNVLYDWYFGKVREGKFKKAFPKPDSRPSFSLASEGGFGLLYGQIYRWEHGPSGEFYLGVCSNAARYASFAEPALGRFEAHRLKAQRGSSYPFHKRLRQTGPEDWNLQIVEEMYVPVLPGPHDIEGAALDVVLYALEAVHGKAEGADRNEPNFRQGKCLNGIGFLGGNGARWFLGDGISAALFDRVAGGESATTKICRNWYKPGGEKCLGPQRLQPATNFFVSNQNVDGLVHSCISCKSGGNRVSRVGDAPKGSYGKHSLKLKVEVVAARAANPKTSFAKLAMQFGVHVSTVKNWVKAAAENRSLSYNRVSRNKPNPKKRKRTP